MVVVNKGGLVVENEGHGTSFGRFRGGSRSFVFVLYGLHTKWACCHSFDEKEAALLQVRYS